jgi:hypothetical protein
MFIGEGETIMGIASLVLGICSIVFTIVSFGCLGWVSIVLGLVGVILGAVDVKKKKENGIPCGLSKAGMICSIVGMCFAIIGLVVLAAIAAGTGY